MLGTKPEFTQSKNTFLTGFLRCHGLEYARLILSATKSAFLRVAASSNNLLDFSEKWTGGIQDDEDGYVALPLSTIVENVQEKDAIEECTRDAEKGLKGNEFTAHFIDWENLTDEQVEIANHILEPAGLGYYPEIGVSHLSIELAWNDMTPGLQAITLWMENIEAVEIIKKMKEKQQDFTYEDIEEVAGKEPWKKLNGWPDFQSISRELKRMKAAA